MPGIRNLAFLVSTTHRRTSFPDAAASQRTRDGTGGMGHDLLAFSRSAAAPAGLGVTAETCPAAVRRTAGTRGKGTSRMTSRWHRMPGRRATAAAAAAIVLASGLTYLGFDGNDRQDDSRPRTGRSAPLTEAAASVQAARSGKAVEASALRTPYSTTWARPDGKLQRRVHASPIRAHVNGEWKAIDTRLTKVKDGWAPRATNVRTVFSAGTGSAPERASRGRSQRVPLLAPAATTADSALAVRMCFSPRSLKK